jgi:C4-dicarboxylate-specific signal transduction histidine kinase
MVAELTHELNQPLSAICSYAQAGKRVLAVDGVAHVQDRRRLCFSTTSEETNDVMLKHNLQVQELSASLNQVSEQADRAAEIIRRLRRFVAKGKPLQSPLDINAMIHEVSGLMSIDARMAGAEVNFDLTEPLPPLVGDRIQLEQVLVNLMRNAFESLRESPPGGRRLRIRTGLDGPQNVVVDVEDNGAGVSPEARERIFDRFFTTKPDGMGMGLSISRSIIENHGGKLSLLPAAGGGAVFRFTLPSHPGEQHHGK